jgi:hypothetical protein
MNLRHESLACLTLRALLVALIMFGSESYMAAQPISFYPSGDSLSLWGTCTPPGVIWHALADSLEFDRVVIHPYGGEFVHGIPPKLIVARFDSAYFTIRDSLHLNRYELWCTSLSTFYPGRSRIPPDTGSWIPPGPFFITLIVYRDSLLIDSCKVGGISYQTGLNVDDAFLRVPKRVQLYQNYPNPFNGGTSIVYDLPTSGYVRVYVVDMLGRIIQTLENSYQHSGLHTLHWEPSNMSSGSHIVVLTAGEKRAVIKCQLLK